MPILVIGVADTDELKSDEEGEETESFHQSGEDDAVDEKFALHFGLTSHTFESSRGGNTDTDTRNAYADCADTCAEKRCALDQGNIVNTACRCSSLGNQLVVHNISP